HFRKLLDTQPPLYCPNKRCSMRVLRHENPDEHDAVCPACKSWICTKCETLMHKGLSCEAFQGLPEDQRADPEDAAVHHRSTEAGWKRLRVALIKVRGDRNGRCSRNPPCELWNDQMLRDAQNRRRQAPQQLQQPQQQQQQVQQQQQQQQAPSPYQAVAPPQPQPHYFGFRPPPPPVQQEQHQQESSTLQERYQDPTFVRDESNGRHPFTLIFTQDTECGYCQRQFANSHALQQHLAPSPHPVSGCTTCERFFRARPHLYPHVDANLGQQHGEYVWEP
ncbi:hypothetical protein JCM8547_003337, partial [Rhodosporidiobolus lusitaniae]